jgi:hypothetical protein
MRRHFQYWGALYILAVLFVGSLIGQYVYQVLIGGEESHQFFSAVFENWQSEWIQLFVQALLIQGLGHVLYRKETEDQERMEQKLDEILRQLGGASPRPQRQVGTTSKK